MAVLLPHLNLDTLIAGIWSSTHGRPILRIHSFAEPPMSIMNGIVVTAVWLVILLLVLLANHLMRAERAQRLALARGHCPNCRYDLRGALDIGCPECGWNREGRRSALDD